MIYLKQTFNIEPATPATRQRFVEHAESALVPGWLRLGGRLVGAWSANEEWFYQIIHVVAFPDLAAFDAARRAGAGDAAWSDAQAICEQLAPVRSESLLESLGPVEDEKLDAAIEATANEPAGEYSFAILEVDAGKMEAFKKLLGAGAAQLPIVASWRDIAGNPNQVIDLWSGNPSAAPYRPSSKGLDAFFGPLRELAPTERMMHLYPLPYSPLR